MSEAWKSTVDAILMIYIWGPLMLLALGAVWTLLIFGVWKIATTSQHIAKKCYEKFICKNSINNKNGK
jgi:hypothetical protein|nr:MAG TPA: hypothetical protein [Siphoviridae sp. ctX8T1]